MCSIAMPAELILGHRPAVYGPLLCGPLVVSGTPIVGRSIPPRIRPCLSSSSTYTSSGSSLSSTSSTSCSLESNATPSGGGGGGGGGGSGGSGTLREQRNDNVACNRRKKRVVFADDRGRPLTQVRVMSEPSNVPPLWSTGLWSYLAGLSKDTQSERELEGGEEEEDKEEGVGAAPWQTTFCQPASDYLAFRRKLDEQKVCLENVIVREADLCLFGTIKVRNLAYDKELIVRTSSDSWKTHEDVHASFVEQPVPPVAYVLYDTFRFRLTLPINSDIVEFCIRYRTNGDEHWDNNDGNNYVVKRKQELRLKSAKRYDASSSTWNMDGMGRISDATRLNIQTWSEFAAWHHLANDSPYW